MQLQQLRLGSQVPSLDPIGHRANQYQHIQHELSFGFSQCRPYSHLGEQGA